MTFVVATVDRQTAWRRLHARGLARRIIDALRRRGGSGAPADGCSGLPRLELLWLPHFLVRFPMRQAERSDEITVLASGHDAAATLVDARGLTLEEGTGRERFSTTIDEAQAIESAQRVLLVARARGPVWRTAQIDIGPGRAQLVHYPFWAYYFARRAGILDVSLLDAWSGRPAGARVKAALLAALAAQQATRSGDR